MGSKNIKTKSATLLTDTRTSLTSDDRSETALKKPKKPKPLTRQERLRLRKAEAALKQRIAELKKEVTGMIADLKKQEQAIAHKTYTENLEQDRRVSILTGVCGLFSAAKARVLHEKNKVRDLEIWERYTTTDQMPYPESVKNMNTHLYVWGESKSTEFMEFALNKCESYVVTLKILDDLIEVPLYSTVDTVKNWKEIRDKCREMFLSKIDKACFNMIKDMRGNLDVVDSGDAVISKYDNSTQHLKLSFYGLVNKKNELGMRLASKIALNSCNAEIVMPLSYLKKSYIVRLIHVDLDMFSDTCTSHYVPVASSVERDLLSDVRRCFIANSEAKASVAGRERDKINAAKERINVALRAAAEAESKFANLRPRTQPVLNEISEIEVVRDLDESSGEVKKKAIKELKILIEASTENVASSKRIHDPSEFTEKGSISKTLFGLENMQRSLDVISNKSGMRKKGTNKEEKSTTDLKEEGTKFNIFHAPSLMSHSKRISTTHIERASDLCFEDPDSDTPFGDNISTTSAFSYNSLDLLFGVSSDENKTDDECKSLKTLVKSVEPVIRKKSHLPSRSDTRVYKRRRTLVRKSLANLMIPEENEAPSTYSEIFESKEDLRQDAYVESLAVAVKMPGEVNLRASYVVGGTYFFDILNHELQPVNLPDGSSTQIFYGERTVKRELYEPPLDNPSLESSISVTVPLPANVVYLETPFVALWDQKRHLWSKEHVHYFLVNEENHTATLKIGRTWPFAFFVNKYFQLPYLKWHLKPNLDSGSVSLFIYCSCIVYEFRVVNFEVCLSSIEGIDVAAMEDVIGKFMPLSKLVKEMNCRGLYLFPDEDALLYVKDHSGKDVVLEGHSCMSIAMFSTSLEFHSSRWNVDAKRRQLVFQVRQSLRNDIELHYVTVTASSMRAAVYKFSDEDDSFDETKADDIPFCPDVFTLLQEEFPTVISQPANILQGLAVFELLSKTKVFSYCGLTRHDAGPSISAISRRIGKKKNRKAGRLERARKET